VPAPQNRKCTTGTHTTFIPPEDHRDEEKAMLDSQAAVLKWTRDFPTEDIDREDNTGLEFKCQLNTPMLTRLHRLKNLGRTNPMALRRTLLDKQDLIQIGNDDFVEEGYHTTRGGWWVRARDEECTKICIQCERAWSSKQVDPEGWCTSCREGKPPGRRKPTETTLPQPNTSAYWCAQHCWKNST